MKKFFAALAVLVMGLALAACGNPAATLAPSNATTPQVTQSSAPLSPSTAAGFQTITAEQAKARMDANPSAIILDVRTQAEYDAGHIPGALLLPNENIADTQPALLPDLDAEILLYCRSGNRSRQAATKLAALGYTNLYDFGGIGSWPYATTTK